MNRAKKITVETTIQAPIDLVWKLWTSPEDIVNWNFASTDWCCPSATNDLRENGKFNWRMEAKDGSIGFDFTGDYKEIKPKSSIHYIMTDGRGVWINFFIEGTSVRLVESFEAEGTHSDELQRAGWQAILENFNAYVSSKK